jgi:zinc transport system permease protein
MLLAVLLSVLFTVLGLAVSYGPDLPAGATIILLAGATYLVATVGMRVVRPFR